MSKPSLYARYVMEREGISIYETEIGFATFKIDGEECYIKDIYIIPEHRKEGVGTMIADEIKEIAKKKGCKLLTGSVSPTANGSHISLLVLIAYGMKLLRAEDNIIYLGKRIE